MLRDDTSPVKDRMKQMVEGAFPAKIAFAACNNHQEGHGEAGRPSDPDHPGGTIVPSGVVRLMELQEQGWSYVRQ